MRKSLLICTHIKSRLPETAAKGRPVAKHTLSDDDFRQLAAGYGTATATEHLIRAQRTLQRALLGAVYQVAGTTPAVPDTACATVRTAWAMLATAEKEQPQALDMVLGHPYTRVWAVRCLGHLKPGQQASEPNLPRSSELAADLSHFAAIAAVIAIRTGAQTEVLVPVAGGVVSFPALGRLVADGREPGHGPLGAVFATDGKVASIRIGRDCWEFTRTDLLSGEPSTVASLGPGGDADWQPVRTLTAAGLTVTLEDTDPYRDCHQWPAADRLTDAEVAQWQRCFADAWCEIEYDFPAYAPAIATGLRMLMPLAPAPAGRDVSAAARHAFGAIGTALPADASTLALLIMHEFQHVKLGAILDLYDLYDPADNRLYHAPWREDMRPLEGLLQGTYAHLAVSEYWRTRQQVTAGAESDVARERSKFWAEHTKQAIETLADSGSMTPLGLDFVEEMRRSAHR